MNPDAGITPFIFGASLVVGVAYLVLIYNSLVRLKNNVERAFANIEILLKQRQTELPQLVTVCKAYMAHEQAVLVGITQARSQVQQALERRSVPALGSAETVLRDSLQNLFVRVEAYPELKANENFLALQERIGVLEDTIADRREIYNESVRLNNTRIQQFPDTLIARPFKFTEFDYLRFAASDLQSVSLAALRG